MEWINCLLILITESILKHLNQYWIDQYQIELRLKESRSNGFVRFKRIEIPGQSSISACSQINE